MVFPDRGSRKEEPFLLRFSSIRCSPPHKAAANSKLQEQNCATPSQVLIFLLQHLLEARSHVNLRQRVSDVSSRNFPFPSAGNFARPFSICRASGVLSRERLWMIQSNSSSRRCLFPTWETLLPLSKKSAIIQV